MFAAPAVLLLVELVVAVVIIVLVVLVALLSLPLCTAAPPPLQTEARGDQMLQGVRALCLGVHGNG